MDKVQHNRRARQLRECALKLKLDAPTVECALFCFHGTALSKLDNHVTPQQHLLLAACVFVAAKNSATPRRSRDVLVITHNVTGEGRAFQLDEDISDVKSQLAVYEDIVLRAHGFVIPAPRLHLHLLALCCQLEVRQQSTALAVALLNNALVDVEVVSLSPREVIVGCLFLASELQGERIHHPAVQGWNEDWWEMFGVSLQSIKALKQCVERTASATQAQSAPQSAAPPK